MNPRIYRNYTGIDPSLLRNNLKLLLPRGLQARMKVRVPRIPDYNTQEDVEQSVHELKDMGITDIDVFSYVRRN